MRIRPQCVIFDRDGTLASIHNGPTTKDKGEWAAYNAALPFDAVVPEVAALLNSIRPGITRIMVSGRMEGDWPGDRRRRFQMEDWIVKHRLPVDQLYMRSGGDQRRDSVIKEEILVNEILPSFTPVLAVDDREVVAEVWERYGIPVIRVTNPGTLPTIGNNDIWMYESLRHFQ